MPVLSATVPEKLIEPLSQAMGFGLNVAPASALPLRARASSSPRMACARRRPRPVAPVGCGVCGVEAGADSGCADTPANRLLPVAAPLDPITFDAIELALVASTVAPVCAPE